MHQSEAYLFKGNYWISFSTENYKLFKETGNYVPYTENRKAVNKICLPGSSNIGITRQRFKSVILIISKEQKETVLRPKGRYGNEVSANRQCHKK